MKNTKPIDSSYFSIIRNDLIKLIPENVKTILDIGCGFGATGNAIKKHFSGIKVIGIEINTDAANRAKELLDKVYIGDAETISPDIPEGSIDCIIFGDVLEHTREPLLVLQKFSTFLTDEGFIIASIPNIRNIKPLFKIIFDKFEYEDYGILDRTHLRFFTLHTIIKMFDEAKLNIISVKKKYGMGTKYKLIRIFTFGLISQFTIEQFLILAKKVS